MQQPEWVQLHDDPAVQQDPTETRNTLLDRLSEHTALGAFIRARFGGTCFYRLACHYWLGGHFLFVASMRQIRRDEDLAQEAP